MQMNFLFLLLLLLFVNSVAAVHATEGSTILRTRKVPFAHKDQDYNQVYSLRYGLKDKPRVAAWPQLAFDGPVTQVVDAGAGTGSFFVVAAGSEAWLCQFPVAQSQRPGLPPSPLHCKRAAQPGRQILQLFVTGPETCGLLLFDGQSGHQSLVPCSKAPGTNDDAAVAATGIQFPASLMGNQVPGSTVDRRGGLVYFPATNGLFASSFSTVHGEHTEFSVPKLFHRPAAAIFKGETCAAVSVAADFARSQLAVGWNCTAGFGLIERTNFSVWRHQFTPGVIDYAPTGLAFHDDGTLWMADNVVHSQAPWAVSRTVTRYGASRGLPRLGARHVAVAPGTGNVYVGLADRGLLRYGPRPTVGLSSPSSSSPQWKTLLGGRWLPGRLRGGDPDAADFFDGQRVQSMASLRMHPASMEVGPRGRPLAEAVVVATDGGLALICSERWTLAAKAEFMQQQMNPWHNRFGIGLTSDAQLEFFANVSSYYDVSTDNDGLHTSQYVVSQSYRYAVTKSPEAYASGMLSFSALEFLNLVTPTVGLLARSVEKYLPPIVGGEWYESKYVFNGTRWWWKANVSSDEVTGHLGTYPIVFSLLAQTDRDRDRAARLQNDMVRYIVDGNYTMIDVDGQPTRWAVWTPYLMNFNYTWEDERGLNLGAELLAYMSGAAAVTAARNASASSFFRNQFQYLVDKHGAADALDNLLIESPIDAAFFDDHLGDLALRMLLYYEWGRSPAFDATLSRTLPQWWSRPRRAHVLEDIMLYSLWWLASGQPADAESPVQAVADGVQSLVDYPMDLIKYASYNCDRMDIRLNLEFPQLPQQPRLLDVVPRDETTAYKWADSPFCCLQCSRADGHHLANPADFIHEYWMARYHGFII